MQEAPDEMPSSVAALDVFYEALAETAVREGLCMPHYKTSLAIQGPQRIKMFRSEMTLPGLRLQCSAGRRYFIPEAKFTGTADSRREAENAAAKEACEYLKNFTQRSELTAADWSMDENNPVFQSIKEAWHESYSPLDTETEIRASEGNRLLVIVKSAAPPPTASSSSKPLGIRTEPGLGSVSRRPRPAPPLSPSSSGSSSGSLMDSDGTHLTQLSNEVSLLKIQVDRLNALIERRHAHAATASISQPASVSYRSEIGPA